MSDLTQEQKEAIDKINEMIVEYELVVIIENNIVIPKPPK